MIFPSTNVARLVAFAARRGAQVEIVAALREELGLRVLRRAVLPTAEADVALADFRARGVEVITEVAAAPLPLAAPVAAAAIPAAPRRSVAPVSIFCPFSLDLILSTQKTRAPNFR